MISKDNYNREAIIKSSLSGRGIKKKYLYHCWCELSKIQHFFEIDFSLFYQFLYANSKNLVRNETPCNKLIKLNS